MYSTKTALEKAIFYLSLWRTPLHGLAKEQVENIRSRRRLLIVKFGITAIFAIDDDKLVVLDIKHFGQACAGHGHLFRFGVAAAAFHASLLFIHLLLPPYSRSRFVS